MDEHGAGPARAAMFPQIDALPSAEAEPALDDRDRERGGRERGAHVRRHVVGTLGVVREERVALGHEPREPALEVAPCRRIRVLLDHQAGRGVLYEERAEALAQARARDDTLDLARELVEAGAARLEPELRDHRGGAPPRSRAAKRAMASRSACSGSRPSRFASATSAKRRSPSAAA